MHLNSLGRISADVKFFLRLGNVLMSMTEQRGLSDFSATASNVLEWLRVSAQKPMLPSVAERSVCLMLYETT